MRYSARVNYGLRAALMLADRFGSGRPVLGKEISVREGLPAAYLEQIMALLRRSDLVTGTRGAGGGYVLTQAPEQIRVTELIEALDGPIQLSDCPQGATCCGTPDECVLNDLYQSAEEALRRVYDAQTLADLLARRRSLRASADMYQI